MNNPRIYEVAKEIGMSSQELRDRLREDGYSIKNNFNAVNPTLLEFIMSNYVGDNKKVIKKNENSENESKTDYRSGVKIEETSSDLKPKEFIVRYVPKSEEKPKPEISFKEKEEKKEEKKEEFRKESAKEDFVKNDEKNINEKEKHKEFIKREKTPEQKSTQKDFSVDIENIDKKEKTFKDEKSPSENTELKKRENDAHNKKHDLSQEKKQGKESQQDKGEEHSKIKMNEKHEKDRSLKLKKQRDKNEFKHSSQKQSENIQVKEKKNHDNNMDIQRHEPKRINSRDISDVVEPPGFQTSSDGPKSKVKNKSKIEKKKISKYEDGMGGELPKTSSKKKKSKSKKGRNIIDESKRTELEKTELNFGKKTFKKKKKRSRRPDSLDFDVRDDFEEVVETAQVVVKERIMVHEFADLLGVPSNELILKLMNLGVMAAINQYIDFDVMQIIAEDYDIELNLEEEKIDTAVLDYDFEDKPEDLKLRAPVVTVMGHVDHGKTSLLDAIRSTSVTEREAGGITQHIGASEVKINGQKIVFLDTPGHEAFTSLRARGVQLTDIAILVVAADDGVMPQTIEAIDHARAADVPIIVAINKIDKPGANPDQVIKELSEHGVLVEDWGGDVVSVKVSAKKKENIDSLLEMVLLVAEIMDLKANPNRNAVGTVIEANLDKGRGSVATVLVQKGTLKISDPFVCGTTYGKVRALYNHLGKKVKQAGPSTAVEIIGMSEVPMAGDMFFAVNSDKEARKIADDRFLEQRADELAKSSKKVSLEALFDQIQAGNLKTLNLIIKADVHGSIEAIRQSLEKIKSDEVKINIQHANIGAITESDIMLATASNTIILGFNVRPSSAVLDLAAKENVEIKTYRIIYELISDVEAALTGMLAPKYIEKQLGEIEVRAIFKVPNVGTIAGAYVTSGKVMRNSKVRLLRNGVIVFEGGLSSLKRFKDDAKEVSQGYECGLGIEGFNDVKEGDTIEVYEIEEVKATL